MSKATGFENGGMMGTIIFLLFLAFFLQGVFTYFQIKDFRKNVAQLRKEGRVGVGNEKRRAGAGAMVILAVDPNEVIINGRLMQGISVFAKFQPYTRYNGSKLINVLHELEKQLEEASGDERARVSATYKAAKMIFDSFREERGAVAESDFSQDIGEEVVDVEITKELDDVNDVYDEFEGMEELQEPQIIDVEEMEMVEKSEE